jgi:hypothetical protein
MIAIDERLVGLRMAIPPEERFTRPGQSMIVPWNVTDNPWKHAPRTGSGRLYLKLEYL